MAWVTASSMLSSVENENPWFSILNLGTSKNHKVTNLDHDLKAERKDDLILVSACVILSPLVVLECCDGSIFLAVHFTRLESCHQTVMMEISLYIRKLWDYILQHTMGIKVTVLESSLNTHEPSSCSCLLSAQGNDAPQRISKRWWHFILGQLTGCMANNWKDMKGMGCSLTGDPTQASDRNEEHKNLYHDSQSLCWNLKPEPPTYKAGLSTSLWWLLKRLW
jgi:hypothetical protein